MITGHRLFVLPLKHRLNLFRFKHKTSCGYGSLHFPKVAIMISQTPCSLSIMNFYAKKWDIPVLNQTVIMLTLTKKMEPKWYCWLLKGIMAATRASLLEMLTWEPSRHVPGSANQGWRYGKVFQLTTEASGKRKHHYKDGTTLVTTRKPFQVTVRVAETSCLLSSFSSVKSQEQINIIVTLSHYALRWLL